MKQNEIENLNIKTNFLRRLKSNGERINAELEAISKWWEVIWEDIFTEGERELYEKFPDNFRTEDSYIRFIAESIVLKYTSPELPPPVEFRTPYWIYTTDSLYYRQGEIYSSSLPDPPAISFDKFWRKPLRINRNGAEDGLVFYKTMRESSKWCVPKICWDSPGKLFFREGKLEHKEERTEQGKVTLQLPDNERVRDLKQALLKYIRAYRKEVTQRTMLWDFLTSPGVGVKSIQKLWPELFV